MVCSWMECSEDQKKQVYSKIYWNMLLSLASSSAKLRSQVHLSGLLETNWITRNIDFI